MNSLPNPIREAIDHLSNLPGIGTRSAERLVLSLLQNPSNLDQKIAGSIGKLKQSIHECADCFHYSESERCMICENPVRDVSQVCIVETPLDVVALERCHEYKGVYHVLHGTISPLNKIKPEDIRISALEEKLKQKEEVREIIFALPSTTEGEATTFYIIDALKPFFQGTITRLSRGIPSGGDLDYLDIGTLGRAVLDRRSIE